VGEIAHRDVVRGLRLEGMRFRVGLVVGAVLMWLFQASFHMRLCYDTHLPLTTTYIVCVFRP